MYFRFYQRFHVILHVNHAHLRGLLHGGHRDVHLRALKECDSLLFGVLRH